eukprot:11494204-Prorocentrum_lima.AAC.1
MPVQLSSAVARSCSLKEALSNPKAKAALDREWDRLRSINTWNENEVREWSEVAQKARHSSSPAHMGRIFAILVEKNSELEPSNPLR